MAAKNPYLDQRRENRNAAEQRAAAAEGRGNPNRNRGNGGSRNDGKSDKPGGADGIVSEKERQFWETQNPDTFWNSQLGSSFGGNNTEFADWFKNTYFDQVYEGYQNAINGVGSKPGDTKWGDYVRDYLSNNNQVMTDFNRYYAENNKDAATQAAFANNGLGAANDGDSAFGNWLNKKMGSQYQTEYAQLNNPGMDYYDFLKQKMGSGAFNGYYDQYMLDPTRVSQTYGPARWQAF